MSDMFYLSEQWMEQVLIDDLEDKESHDNIPDDGLENSDPQEPDTDEYNGFSDETRSIIQGMLNYTKSVDQQITDAYDENLNPGQQEQEDE